MVTRLVRNYGVMQWAFVSILVLAASLACTNSPDFERTRDYNRPETVLLSWFSWEASHVGSGYLPPLLGFPQCSLGELSLG